MIESPLRQRHDLSEDWEFIRGRVSRRWLKGSGHAGERVLLPHCWNRADTFQYGRRSYSGRGAYRRVLDLPDSPASPGSWYLRSEGFYGFGDIWLDGRAIARFDGQYLGFDKEIPRSVPSGRHVLAVRLDNLFQRNVLPGRRDPDFLLYGGLAGRIWLEWVPALRIGENTVDIVCQQGPEGTEIIELRCTVRGFEHCSAKPRVHWIITEATGEDVAVAGPTPASDSSVENSTMILDPKCWSPDKPQLYWAEGRLETDEGTADSVRVRFGITRAEFRPGKGFFLNATRVDLHGWNRHESIPGLGNALREALHRADARLLKVYGCNFVRLSHYPQHPSFLDACDELGILVYAEIATWKSVRSAKGWRRAARRQMRDLILRDRHHPSVIVWGMGNESRSRTAYLELREIAHELDPTRPVTYAENHLHRARKEKTVGIPDVWGVNYELDKLEEAGDACGSRTVIVTECCNYPASIKGDDGAELTQVATLKYEWRLMADRPYVAGHAVWSFTDYATEYRHRVRRQSGLFDAWRQPKMAAELFRARYADEAFISLFLAGSHDGVELHVFNNCGPLRLMRDGAPAGELGAALHHVVPLAGDFDRIVVEGERHGHSVVEELRMWGEAATVSVIGADPSRSDTTVAIDLAICDANGTQVRNWNGRLTLSVEGNAQLRAYDDDNTVQVSRGEGRAYVEVGRRGGAFMIHATADGLEPSSKSFSAQHNDDGQLPHSGKETVADTGNSVAGPIELE